MHIKILHLKEGAKKATGAIVIIDVFRAFTVESYLTGRGAGKIIPVGDMQIAYDYKRMHPEAVLIGERQGRILPGFDFGNSPSQIKNFDFTGKTVIHTTSAGTQGIANAQNAEVILGAALVNARATAEYIKAQGFEEVSLVCMGLDAKAETAEDTLCAEYIKSILEGSPIKLEDRIEKLKFTSGAKFFDKALQDVFPEEDFWLSTKPDIFRFALRLEKEENGLSFMQREEI